MKSNRPMTKRPLDSRFSDLVKSGSKTTTIRRKAWPVGKPVMLFNWTGKAYRTKQQDVAAVMVTDARPIKVTHREDGGMIYAYGQPGQRLLHETEGFPSRSAMDEWFRPLVPPGDTREMHLMSFQLATTVEPTEMKPNPITQEKKGGAS